jgi:hypothetical protein
MRGAVHALGEGEVKLVATLHPGELLRRGGDKARPGPTCAGHAPLHREPPVRARPDNYQAVSSAAGGTCGAPGCARWPGCWTRPTCSTPRSALGRTHRHHRADDAGECGLAGGAGPGSVAARRRPRAASDDPPRPVRRKADGLLFRRAGPPGRPRPAGARQSQRHGRRIRLPAGRRPDGLEHIEFATKFYLLQGEVHGDRPTSTPSSAPTWPTAWAARCARCSSASCSWAASGRAGTAAAPRGGVRAPW